MTFSPQRNVFSSARVFYKKMSNTLLVADDFSDDFQSYAALERCVVQHAQENDNHLRKSVRFEFGRCWCEKGEENKTLQDVLRLFAEQFPCLETLVLDFNYFFNDRFVLPHRILSKDDLLTADDDSSSDEATPEGQVDIPSIGESDSGKQRCAFQVGCDRDRYEYIPATDQMSDAIKEPCVLDLSVLPQSLRTFAFFAMQTSVTKLSFNGSNVERVLLSEQGRTPILHIVSNDRFEWVCVANRSTYRRPTKSGNEYGVVGLEHCVRKPAASVKSIHEASCYTLE